MSLALLSCSDETTQPDEEIDKQALLVNYADNLIIPSFSELNDNSIKLSESLVDLKEKYSPSNLENVRTAYIELATSWQSCSMYGFGPAQDIQLRQAINTFPTDTVRIVENISSGSYSLAISSNFKAKGLPALGYLLYPNENENTEEYFTDDNLLTYLTDLVNDINNNISYVNNGWNDYREEFITNLGNDAGSSLSIMINEFVFDYEIAKRAKVGIPSGIYGSVLPYNFEAPHSNLSYVLLHENLTAYKRFITGPNNNDSERTDNIQEYLDALSATRNDSDLSLIITEELNESISKIETFRDPMHEMVQEPSGKEKIDALYKNMQEMVVLVKTDMTSSMGILISYQDNDGD
jgi:predicted lipoprotein